ncbi:MAG: hypothetical protein C0508_21480 [Cyanobacteria bacterium PR.023]|nr:hypothetical protein [Cyanobacteria bacterium PR.023]
MKNYFYSLCVGAFLLIAPSAIADTEDHGFKSNCSAMGTEELQKRNEIEPWLSELNEKVKGQPECGALFKSWPKPLRAKYVEKNTDNKEVEKVAYFFTVTKDGAIENLTLRVGSDKTTVDKQAHDLISSTAPLKMPPNDLVGATKNGVVLILTNDGHSVTATSFVPRLVPKAQ